MQTGGRLTQVRSHDRLPLTNSSFCHKNQRWPTHNLEHGTQIGRAATCGMHQTGVSAHSDSRQDMCWLSVLLNHKSHAIDGEVETSAFSHYFHLD